MKVFSSLMALVVLVVLSFAELFAGPRVGGPAAKAGGAVARGGGRNQIQRYWRPAFPVAPPGPFYHRAYYYNYPYAYYGHNPRSVIIITPSTYDPHYAPATVVTSEPFYCHMHHVGFVSRVGFLDHISGTHKIPLETANAICTDANDSCVIEGY